MVKQLRILGVLSLVAAGLVGCGKSSQPAINGQPNTGIIGGVEATGTEDYAKTIVMLYNAAEGSLCTASIISDQNLVTAAHCVDGPAANLRIVFGTDLANKATRIVKAVDSYETSPVYAFRSSEEFNTGDIAVVKFSGGLPPGFQAAPILRNAGSLQNGVSVMLAGYGIANGVSHEGAGKLRSVEVNILNNQYSESEVLLDQTQGKGACHGDSGGPAYINVGGQWMLWGVTNRGVNDPKNDCSVSASYASIPYYASWITKTAAKLNGGSSNGGFNSFSFPIAASGN